MTVLTGCSDNPDAKAAKEVRQETAKALQEIDHKMQYDEARQKVTAAMASNRPKGTTLDAALLASGSLALGHGNQKQADLALLAVPVRRAVDELEQLIRTNEQLILETERINGMLASGDKEKADLQTLLEQGMGQEPSLNAQRSAAEQQMKKLQAEKAELQKQYEQTQATLDDYQKQADDLLRQAELKQADEKLKLQQQGYAILQQRKDYYIQAQQAENQINNLDQQISLVQVQLDNLNASIEYLRSKINAIEDSQSRRMLMTQTDELETMQNVSQREMAAKAQQITDATNTYYKAVEELLAIYDEAAGEFEKISGGSTAFAATLGKAEAAHRAALAASALISLQTDLNESLTDLLQTAEAELAEAVRDRLPIKPVADDFKQKTMDYFASAFENYTQAYDAAGQDAQCSVLKSHVVAVSHKMRLADKIADYDLANATETTLNELVAKGKELGACFTQSEALRVIENEGLNYIPELPLNVEVLAEGLKRRFSDWKRLPVNEQEAAVNSNLQEIENLIGKYGDALTSHLEPLRQEMTQAKERGFTEAVNPSGAADPNSL